MARWRPSPFLEITAERINRLPKWAREYLHHDTFVGAQEVQEIFYFAASEPRSPVRLVAELKAENRRLAKQLAKRRTE
jgi:hypothetical protein